MWWWWYDDDGSDDVDDDDNDDVDNDDNDDKGERGSAHFCARPIQPADGALLRSCLEATSVVPTKIPLDKSMAPTRQKSVSVEWEDCWQGLAWTIFTTGLEHLSNFAFYGQTWRRQQASNKEQQALHAKQPVLSRERSGVPPLQVAVATYEMEAPTSIDQIATRYGAGGGGGGGGGLVRSKEPQPLRMTGLDALARPHFCSRDGTPRPWAPPCILQL